MSEGLSTEDLEHIDEFCRLSDGAMRSILAQGKHSASWDHVIEQVVEWCIDLGSNVETSDPFFPQLVRQFADTEKQANQIISARNQGENPVFPVIEPEKPRLSAMLEHYTRHRESKVGRKTFTTNVSIWKRFSISSSARCTIVLVVHSNAA